MINEKVTIITPCWNSSKYIEETISSVQSQTYTNWEMIIVDDCSTDNSVDIINRIAEKDSRIRLLIQEKNSGAAKARTRAMLEGTGRYMAYLDADDIWKSNKLEEQVRFMNENKYAFSCTSYEVIDDNGKRLNKYVHMLPKVSYVGFLTNNLLQTVGIMVDVSIIDKKYLVMPDLRRRQDAATWLQILKAGYECYGLDKILSEYRRAENSLSSNKIKAVKGVWSLYRDIEHLSLPFSCYCFIRYAFLAVWKRVYINEKNKVLLVATTADNRERLDGETIKCRLLREYLLSIDSISVESIDTDDWKKHVFSLIFKIIKAYINADIIVLSSADNGAHILLNFLRVINSKKTIYYFVIGGSLSRNIQEKKWKVNTYDRVKKIYVESDLLKKELNDYSLNNVELLNNFRKIDSYENCYIESEELKFVFFGRVIKEKGIEHSIKLIKRLNDEGYKCSLDIFGQITEDYSKTISKMLNDKIHYRGLIVPDNKSEYEMLSKYDVFLFPTEYPGECFPGALIDSYIAGLATFASNWKYAKEYINDGKNGIIFNYKDYEDMYNKSKIFFNRDKLIEFKKKSKEMSKNYLIENILFDFKKEISEV
ncbi:glycosyltransferase [Sporanaerobacter acetigenes]|uniref:glycosyltransferase n=1 Tax=Sporanaerobacter acetigenes TaxID=165813 RepID=UPI00331BDE55